MRYINFFETIDTEEKAYWLGFIAADGYNSDNGLVIDLARRDRGHLEKFAKIFDGYYKVKDCEREFPSSRILLSSIKCSYDLDKYGIVRAKSLILDVDFSLIPDELVRHFIRGYFDGDGLIYCVHPDRVNGYNYDEWGCNFTGTKMMLEKINKYLPKQMPIREKIGCYTMECNGTLGAYEICEYMYKDATIYLDRKMEKFLELQGSQRLRRLVSKRDYFAEEKDTSILVGLILGGAPISNLKVVKQDKERWKLEYVKSIFDAYGYNSEITKKFDRGHDTFVLKVDISPEVAKHYKHQFYPNGNKTVTRHLLNELNNDALSIWFTLNTKYSEGGTLISTLKYTDDECKIIKNYFEVVHGLDVRERHPRKTQTILYITAASSRKFLEKVFVPRNIQDLG